MTKKLIKSKILTILLVLVMLVGSLPISVGDDSTEALSIYNSTAGLTNIPIIDDIDDESTDTVSIYNSTNGSANIPITDDIDDEPIAAVSIYNSTNGSASRPIIDAEENFFELTEFKKVPIDNAYSKDKLQNINVSDGTLEAFSRFGQWLDTQNVNAAAEDINIMYIDDDLRVIENYWIFATRPESKERYIEIIRESKSRNPSPDEMIDFLDRFDERYPVKYVRTGLALFITVENKDALLSEISKEDIRMLEAIRSALLEETRMELNWGSSNPNIHADMSRWAAERAGFDPYYVNIISNHAAKPDEVSYIDVMLSNIVEFTPSGILINGILISTVEFLYLKNYNHYYNPTALNGNGVGGAPANIEKELNSILTATSKEEKVKHLSYASHYMADLSMPLHTNHAVNQSRWFGLGLLFGQPHFAYENDYVGKNWTTGQTGHNFSHFAKNVNGGYIIHDPVAQSKDLANYAYLYSDEAWAAGNLLAVFGNLYTPPPSLFYATIFSIDEGQRHMIGLMEYGYQLIESPASGFTNQQDITLQLEKPGYRVQKVDLTNLRVSMGAGDSAYIHLNGREILRFVDSSSGGTLRVFNENGNQLGIIAPVNGKTTFENRTFDVSFIHDGSRMIIEIQRYHRGVPDGTFSYSYMTNNDMSTLRAYMIGYQSNVDYISSQYNIHYQPLSGAPLGGSFENQQDITLQLGKAGHRVQKVDLTNLRVSMGAGDSAYIHLNGREILRFVDSSSGGTLRIYNENG
ncbi:MAG: hypothetical protein LBE57_00455, partial [Methanosarcinales archaeon]|nr:hypothetical protein [Methanosarcinales archaeon]